MATTHSSDTSAAGNKNLRPSLKVFIFTSALLLRVLVGFHPHSGQDNYHGKTDAYGGDYEAQRHWMELTLHLPPSSWYRYDLQYWGLDYPPLTAYHSYLCGFLSHALVGPQSVALLESRAYEDPTHKAFMRGTVLFFDALVYFTAAWALSYRLAMNPTSSGGSSERWLWLLAMALAQPAVVLIDHGHFQYNTVSLGLSLWSFHFMTLGYDQEDVPASNEIGPFFNCVLGSILFCLALNFKQMSLYYAPAVFSYLLGRCFRTEKKQSIIIRFLILGVTVIASFAVLWWPFAVYPYLDALDSEGPMKRTMQVVSRLFPFQRGLFEGKVANLWCALSIKPFSIRNRIPLQLQPIVALVFTLALVLPACVVLFSGGRGNYMSHNQKEKGLSGGHRVRCSNKELRLLLWGTASTGLAFFLASFQVHEKSILMPLAPLSLLALDSPAFTCWFSLVSAWTLWPLIQVDRLQEAYLCCMAVFTCLVLLRPQVLPGRRIEKPGYIHCNDFLKQLASLLVPFSVALMVLLHISEAMIEAPLQLPDLFPVLWSVMGCAMFCLSWLVSCWELTQTFQDIEY